MRGGSLDPSHYRWQRPQEPHNDMYVVGHNDPRKPLVQAIFAFALFQRVGHKRCDAWVPQPERAVLRDVQQMVALRKDFTRILHRRLGFAQAGKRAEKPPRQKLVGKVSLVVVHLASQAKGLLHKEGVKSHELFSSKCSNSKGCEAAPGVVPFRLWTNMWE